MSRFRAAGSALLLFVGAAGTLGGLGFVVFEEALSLAVYGTGVTAGSAWLSWGTYRAELTSPTIKRPPEPLA
ncbi:MAG: hypothetical protein U1E62_10845 [Alsobacter sp.]